MTVYDMVLSDLGLPPANQFAFQIDRIINHTQAVILRFLRLDTLPDELSEILVDATESYFVQKYPDYASGSEQAAIDAQEVVSISDNGQSISYRSGMDNISQEAKAAGLDDVLGRYYGTLILYRRAW